MHREGEHARASLTSFEKQTIKDALDMSSGYVLNFSDKSFAEFFSDFQIIIDDVQYQTGGSSKAKRLMTFLTSAPANLAGDVLAELLKWRQRESPPLNEPLCSDFDQIVTRLRACTEPRASPPATETSEDALPALSYDPEVFAKLPFGPDVVELLKSRMVEAQRCINCEAFLAAVVLLGSVLEGMCLGYVNQNAELANRTFGAIHNGKTPPVFAEWKLSVLISVLSRLSIFSPNVTKFGHNLRDFRNYIHPNEQLKAKFCPNRRSTNICMQVVLAAAEDIVRASLAVDPVDEEVAVL